MVAVGGDSGGVLGVKRLAGGGGVGSSGGEVVLGGSGGVR